MTEMLFNSYVYTSSTVAWLKLLTILSGQFILVNSTHYINKHTRVLFEYPLILVLSILFMALLVGAHDTITAFLTIVGFSLNLYVLILFDATSAVAREAGIKYFYLSTVSSGLLVYGVFLLFLASETGHLTEIGQVLASGA